jgi:hypothetical protein
MSITFTAIIGLLDKKALDYYTVKTSFFRKFISWGSRAGALFGYSDSPLYDY